jgi:hypothetical protein
VVANAFAERDFTVVATVDIDQNSNATIKDDICNLDPSTLTAVADSLIDTVEASTLHNHN